MFFLILPDKTFLLWAAMFVIGFAFGDGGLVPNDPVFDCLQGTSYDAMECYHDVSKRFGMALDLPTKSSFES